MQTNIKKSAYDGFRKLLPVFTAFIACTVFLLLPAIALAQIPQQLIPQTDLSQIPSPAEFWEYFDGTGDPYSSVFLNQMFGPLFESASGAQNESIFPKIVSHFNTIVLLVGGMMFFYNVSVGIMQTAHEGKVLGQQGSSLWAPIRVVMAVGLLVTVPGTGGYNMGQAGIAFIVQGSTKMASSVWAKTANLVLDGDIPIAGPVTNLDPTTMKAMYNQAACITSIGKAIEDLSDTDVLMYTQDAPTPNININLGGIGYDLWYPEENLGKDYREFNYTAINTGGSPDSPRWIDHGVCGSWITPDLPQYLKNIIREVEQGNTTKNKSINKANAEIIENMFTEGHKNIMKAIQDDLLEITNSRYNDIMQDNTAPFSIAGNIANIHIEANKSLSELATNIRELATSKDIGLFRPRDELLRRINGSGECFSEDGSHNVTISPTELENTKGENAITTKQNQAASVACYGEGWMGAGTWYILLAKINNELSSLTNARSSTVAPTYVTSKVDGYRWWEASWTPWSKEYPTRNQILEAMTKFEVLYNTSSMELAALGYPIPISILTEINNDTETDSHVIWRTIVPEEFMLRATRAFMNFFDPGRGEHSTDPMINLINLGKWLNGTGAFLMVTAAVGGTVAGGLAIILLPIFSVLITVGITLSFILPIMPFLYWILAISGYFLLIAEAIIAVNLWALSHLRMDGEGLSGEGGRRGWLMMLALFMTPTLMIFGYVVGMQLFRIVSDLISAGLFYTVSGILGTNPISFLFGIIGYTCLIVLAYILLLERSFSLISEFPNRAMQWMGSEVVINGGQERIQMAAAGAAAAMNNLSNNMEKSIAGVRKGVETAGISMSGGRGISKGG